MFLKSITLLSLLLAAVNSQDEKGLNTDCGQNSFYTTTADACPKYCNYEERNCEHTASVNGCECHPGYVRLWTPENGDQGCVTPENCPKQKNSASNQEPPVRPPNPYQGSASASSNGNE